MSVMTIIPDSINSVSTIDTPTQVTIYYNDSFTSLEIFNLSLMGVYAEFKLNPLAIYETITSNSEGYDIGTKNFYLNITYQDGNVVYNIIKDSIIIFTTISNVSVFSLYLDGYNAHYLFDGIEIYSAQYISTSYTNETLRIQGELNGSSVTIQNIRIFATGKSAPTGTNNTTNSNNVNFLALGGGNGGNSSSILYSSDGQYWNSIANGTSFLTNYGRDAAWNGNIWIAVGSDPTGNTIVYSYDGINWNFTGGMVASYYSTMNGVKWIPTLNAWIVVGYNNISNSILTSTDGIYWNPYGYVQFMNGGYAIDWDRNSIIVVVGDDGGGLNTIMYCNTIPGSFVDFTSAVITGSLQIGYDVKYNGQYWVVAGQIGGGIDQPSASGQILYSNDGINFNNATGDFSNSYSLNAIGWNGQKWIVGGTTIGQVDGIFYYSTDGINWTQSVNIIYGYGGITGLCWTGTYWIAMVSNNVGDNTYAYSSSIFISYDNANTWNLIVNGVLPGYPGSAGRIVGKSFVSVVTGSSNGGTTGPTGPAGPSTSIIFDGGTPYSIYSSGPVLDCGTFQ